MWKIRQTLGESIIEPAIAAYTLTLVGRTGVVEVDHAALAAARHKAALTQKDLAELAGAGRDQISEWETGKHKPDVHQLYRLAQALGTPVRALLAPTAPITLHLLRICAGWTQEELAGRIGMSRSLWSLVETGQRDLADTEADALAAALDLQPVEVVKAARRTAGVTEDQELRVVTIDLADQPELAGRLEADRRPGETWEQVLLRWARRP